MLAGDSAFVIDLASAPPDGRAPEEIDVATNARVIALAHAVGGLAVPGVRDIVPAFTTLAVHFDPLRTETDRLASLLEELARAPAEARASEGACVDVPVCYGFDCGPDLNAVATATGLEPSRVIDLHVAPLYRVFMIGFSPGFPYLGVVDARLRVPRRSNPRVTVPAGSVGLAGPQTGIYPVASPGGWNIIGRTPLKLFDESRDEPCLLRPGGSVRFRAITASEFQDAAGMATGGR